MKTIETNTARLTLNKPKSATVWRMLFGLAVAVMLSSPVTAAPPSANSSVRMITATDLMPTGVDGNARGKINVNMTRQGSAINQEVKISAVNLDPNTVYGLIGYLGDDTNATGVAEFTTDRKGAFNVTYVRKSQGKPGPHTQPLPAAIDLMCNVRELSVINRDLGIVLRGILTNPNRGSYQANLTMNNTGFLPRATGTVAIQAGPRSTSFLLRASGLVPRTFYSFTINGGVIDAKMSDKAGRLVLQQLPLWVPDVLDIHTVGVNDGSGNNVILTSDGLGIPCDTTVPTVTATSPADLATNVPINHLITATFSEAMNSTTISSNTFILQQGSNAVNGTVNRVGVETERN
ncbi:MAG: Ig-like domain-containing protein [Verrucomicrobiae bacterium]